MAIHWKLNIKIWKKNKLLFFPHFWELKKLENIFLIKFFFLLYLYLSYFLEFFPVEKKADGLLCSSRRFTFLAAVGSAVHLGKLY
jgi:hypothetical protein